MKHLFFILFVLICLTSCKKNNSIGEPIDDKLFKIGFSTTGFKTSIDPISKKAAVSNSTTTDIDTNVVNNISFIVYTLDNKLIGKFDQKSTDTEFGILNLKIAAGTYKIAVAGYKREKSNFTSLNIVQNGPNYDFSFPPDYDHDFLIPFKLENRESFTSGYYREFTVGKDSIYAPLEMKHLNAKLEIQFTDILPDDISRLDITYENDNHPRASAFARDAINQSSYDDSKNTFNMTAFGGKKDVIISDIVYPTKKSGTKINLIISLMSKTRSYNQIKLSNVTFKSDYVTKISGPGYGNIIGNNENNFSVALDPMSQDTIRVDF